MILLLILKSIKKFLISIIISLSVKIEGMSHTIGKFISNNVKGFRSSEKRLKIFEYLKSNIHHKGFVFLQEIHSLKQYEKKWKDNFKDPLFFFTHGSTSSCGVAIGFCGMKYLYIIDKKSDKNGRI